MVNHLPTVKKSVNSQVKIGTKIYLGFILVLETDYLDLWC